MEGLKERVERKLLDKNGDLKSARWFDEECKRILKELEELFPEHNRATALALVLFGEWWMKRCPVCQSIIQHDKGHCVHPRATFCSTNCKGKSKEVKEKVRKTNLERYGVEVSSKSKEVKEKVRKTNLERYGVEWTTQNEEVRGKAIQTSIERYGVPNPSSSIEVREKVRKTNMERYGVENPMQSKKVTEGLINPFSKEEVKEKIRKTNLERYGVPVFTQSEGWREKVIQTNMERYGAEWHTQRDSFKERLKEGMRESLEKRGETCMERYGVPHYFLSEDFRGKMKGFWEENVSKPQLRLMELLYGFDEDMEIVLNDRELLNPLEVDILLPSYKLAIEVDGIYYHSKEVKDEGYHLGKTESALSKGWRLLHFWDEEILREEGKVLEVLKNQIQGTIPSSNPLDRRHYPQVEGRKTPPRLVEVGGYKCWDCGMVERE